MYDIRDLLDKSVMITDKKIANYTKLFNETADIRLKSLLRIMIISGAKDKQFYLYLKSDINDDNAHEIDFATYDMMSSLINQYVRTLIMPEMTTKSEVIMFSLQLEKSLYALMTDIQGRLVQNEGLSETITYRTLTKMIKHKSKAIESLEVFADE